MNELRERIQRGEDGGLGKKLARAAGIAAMSERSVFIRRVFGEHMETSVEALSLNDLLMIGVPAELFVEYALQLKKAVEGKTIMLVGYCNDIVGYVVTPEADEEGGYEAGASFLEPSSGRIIVEAALALCRELAEDRQAGTPLPP